MVHIVIKEIATRQGLNQSRLQMKAGVTAQLLNRYWNNNVKSVELEPFSKIAKALGVKTSELLSDEEEAKEATR